MTSEHVEPGKRVQAGEVVWVGDHRPTLAEIAALHLSASSDLRLEVRKFSERTGQWEAIVVRRDD